MHAKAGGFCSGGYIDEKALKPKYLISVVDKLVLDAFSCAVSDLDCQSAVHSAHFCLAFGAWTPTTLF